MRRTDPKLRVLPIIVFGVIGAALAALIGDSRAQQTPPVAAEGTALDQPLKWLYEARAAYARVQDYTTTFIRQERVQGQMLPQNIISMKVRTQPYSVNMRWLSPPESRGQELSYIAGRNRNMLRVKSAKPLQKVVGYVSVEQDDPRVMQQTRHSVSEAGFGTIIEQTIKSMELERTLNKTTVRVAEYSYDNRPCHRIEAIRTVRHPEFYCYRTVLFLDKQTKLPVRVENYDWPVSAGADGELLEMFSYVSTSFNVGLRDGDFER